MGQEAGRWSRLETKLRALIETKTGDPREAEVARARAEARAEAVEARWNELLPKLTREAQDATRTRNGMHGVLRSAGAAVVPVLLHHLRKVEGNAHWIFPLLGEMGADARTAIDYLERIERHGPETSASARAAGGALGKIRAALKANKK